MKLLVLTVIAALYMTGVHTLECPEGEVKITSCPRHSEATCADPKGSLQLLSCLHPACHCASGTLREEFTKACYPINDCPDYSYMLAIIRRVLPNY